MKRLLLSLCLAAGVAGLSVCATRPALADEPNANATSYATKANPETLVLDARMAPRGLMQSTMSIPVKPGPFTMVYPKWIPGEHGPTGPLADISQIRVTAGGKSLSWRRDQVDMYAFHVDVPQGVSRIDVTYTVILNGPGDVMSTRNLAIVNWNRDLFYQNDTNSKDVYFKPSIILPNGWSYGTALPVAHQSGNRVDFDEVALNMLVDSPLDCGRFYKHVKLWQNGSAYQMLDMFADKPEDLDVSKKVLDEYKRMTPEALALYGARHWYVYHSLLALSDAVGFQGIEHHQSSDDRAPDDFMVNPMMQMAAGDLVTHEFSHSWNGKYRRPFDLWQPNFQIPEHTELLWVYEGMNQYLGDLLSFRTGIREPKLYPEYLASIYAQMDYEPGRLTEPIIDTTTAAPYLYQARGDYSTIRRTAGDFYTEGELIWLDADTIIRQLTHGKKSLDNFLHLYAGPPNTGPITVTYNRAQIEHYLNEVVPYDWHGFFQRYVYDISVHPPSDDFARAGWKLVYNSTPNKFEQAQAAFFHSASNWYSIGLNVGGDGAVQQVREYSPAWKAGLALGMKIVAVNGRAFSSDVLDNAIKAAQHSSSPIALIVNQDGYFQNYAIDYHGGLRYPHLVRIKGVPDMLAKIMAAHAK